MNKTAIKNYAIWARVQLIEAVKQKAFEYEVTENGENKYSVDSVGGRLLSKTEKEQRQKLLDLIRRKGYEQVMEEAAYTWFNRFIALRFMEVNGYLPSKVRVFTDENGVFKPEIMKQSMNVDLDGLDREKVFDLLDKQNNEELYKYLLITQCNALHEGLPGMFEKIGAWTELLFPKNLLRDDSVIAKMISEIPEEDWKEQVEIIGWLYQYYNTEPKDKVFSRPSGQKIRKEDVPAATQLFTPDWIVRYMVENSLGRLWAENSSASHTLGTSPLGEVARSAGGVAEKMGWKYYLPEAEQSDDVQAKLLEMRKSKAQTSIEEITFLDPCMGSGHILVYAFDVFMQIYTSQGYTERDAAQKIVENNLYGLELDDRAAQLAYFAVMMKARSYDRRFLGRGIRPNLCSVKESNNINPDYLELFGELKETARKLYDEFIDAKEYGSILNLKITAEEIAQLEEKCSEIIDGYYDNIIDTIRQVGIRTDFPALLRQAKIMVSRYDVVCTNPPYMGSSGFSGKLSEFVKKQYPDSKSDMSTVFMEKCIDMCCTTGYISMINIPVWMFLSSYEKLRENIIRNNTFINMVHPGRGIFGSDFGTTTFTIGKKHIAGYLGSYRRLFDVQGEVKSNEVRKDALLSGKGAYTANQDNFSKIPGSPVAYWVSENFIRAFENTKLSDRAKAVKGLDTCDNDTYTRLWSEVDINKISFIKSDATDTYTHKWYPYCKGGGYSKWYGFLERIVNWENDGSVLRNLRNAEGKIKSRPQNTRYYFKEGLTWSTLTSYKLSLRYMNNCIFGGGGSAMFCDNNIMYYLGFINSKVTEHCLSVLNPTLNFLVGDILSLPIILSNDEQTGTTISTLVEENISLSKADWDSFETSWDFERHPLVTPPPR